MTENKTFKRRVRTRMSKTGESYATARAQGVGKRAQTAAARELLARTDDLVAEASLRKATGRSWDEWFAILDRWGATKRTHTEIARHVAEDHRIPGWWAQTVTVGYERARGMRLKHQNAQGFSVSASKTIAVPLDVLFEAFVDDDRRKRWMPDATLSLRTAQPGRSARFDWEDGSTRIVAGFTAKGETKSQIAIAHEKLPDAGEAEAMKAMWRERLTTLKEFLEA